MPEPYYSEIAERFAEIFPEKHLLHLSLDNTISTRTWTNYFSSLDYDHVYFLESDVNYFKNKATLLDDELKKGNIRFAYDVFEVLKKRVRNRLEYVSKLLEEGFDFKKQEVYKIRGEKSPFPKNLEEMNEIWRKKIKNEYLRYIVPKQLAEEKKDTETDEKKKEPDADNDSPEKLILKRYNQFLIVLEDNDAEWVLQKYLSAFAHSYDPHSDYMSPSVMEDFNIQMNLSLGGIGALLKSEDGAAKIVRIIPGGPADRDKSDKKLEPGDKIIAVAQNDKPPVSILHWPLNKIVKKIRGEKGTKVVLTVIPASEKTGATTKLVDLIRDTVKLEEQAANWTIKKTAGTDGVTRNMAVITLPAFYMNIGVESINDPEYRSSSYDVEKIIEQINTQNVEGIVLDLRNNGGGALLEAIRMTGLFIKTGPVVQVRERYMRVLKDRDPFIASSLPLIVLVNRLSASASEILAGALQDYGRAIIVGDTKTHGKGTVQTIIELGRNKKFGSIKITTADYYRVSGSSTQLKGITSDIILPSPFNFMDFGEDFLPNAIPWSMASRTAYLPAYNLVHVISLLKQQSEKRISKDQYFADYMKLVDRIAFINKTKELPLNIDERKKLARTEKEVSSIQEKLMSMDEKDKEKLIKDPVLMESLRILADFITVKKELLDKSSLTAMSEKRTITQIITEWIRRNL